MNEKGLVSIIVPTHNRADVLPLALESIIRQTYCKWETFVIANNCSDNTQSLVKPFLQDKRIHFINIPEAIGASKARNIGLSKAKGEYIAFLDDDDQWHFSKLEKQVQMLNENPDIAIAGCNHFQVGINGVLKIRYCEKISFDDMLYSNYMGSFSFCMTRSNLIKDLELDKRVESSEDWKFWNEIMITSGMKANIIQEYLVKYDYSTKRDRLSFDMANKYWTYLRFVHFFWQYMKKSHKFYHLAVLKSKRSCVMDRFNWSEIFTIAYFLIKTDKILAFDERMQILFRPFFCGKQSILKTIYHKLRSAFVK